MKPKIFVVTGTDTGVGKTVVTCLLTRALQAAGRSVLALKPIASGSRADALALQRSLARGVSLDSINPWFYRAPLAPLLSALREGRSVRLAEVVAFVNRAGDGSEMVLVEGAGGLLSPLGKDFDSRTLIAALGATPIVVAPNRLGAINQVRLVCEALPPGIRRRTRVVLVAPSRGSAVSRTNSAYLASILGQRRFFALPWFDGLNRPELIRLPTAIQRRLQSIVD